MDTLGKWFSRTRKRSNSMPASKRQILVDFLNRSATDPSYNPQLHISEKHTSLSVTKSEQIQSDNSVPMLLTSAYYNVAYPFEQSDSSKEEALIKTDKIERVSKEIKKTLPLTSHYAQATPFYPYRTDSKQNYQKETVAQDLQHLVTWDSFDEPFALARNNPPFLKNKRIPTPFNNQQILYSDSDDNLSTASKGDASQQTHLNEEFEKLKDAMKKLEKRHKRREKRMYQKMMDAQQQIAHLLYSYSYEHPSFFDKGNYYHSNSLSQQQNQYDYDENSSHQDTSYWYDSYENDYFTDHTLDGNRAPPPQSHQKQYYDEHYEYKDMRMHVKQQETNENHSSSKPIYINQNSRVNKSTMRSRYDRQYYSMSPNARFI
ncbi:MAG: hypothetical protein EXX96DRAFT_556665 [Benjaminiella poitrasii]|nr:MAG: hypothetical protein EXX96DRAFT_556665 [Benjaminiella poitrasii]